MGLWFDRETTSTGKVLTYPTNVRTMSKGFRNKSKQSETVKTHARQGLNNAETSSKQRRMTNAQKHSAKIRDRPGKGLKGRNISPKQF